MGYQYVWENYIKTGSVAERFKGECEKRDTVAQVFSCEFFEIFKDIFFV